MPVWTEIILAVSAFVALVGTVWSKILRPGMRAAALAEEMLPLLRELTLVFRDSPGVFTVLDEIAAQFRTNHGSSLRDVVNGIEAAAELNRQVNVAAAEENRRAGELLKVGVESSRILAERDRQQLDRLVILLDRLTVRVDVLSNLAVRLEQSGERIEVDRAQTAAALTDRETAVDLASSSVASDLLARQQLIDAALSDVAADLTERQALVDKLSSGVALDLTERQRLIDIATSGVALDLTERQRLIDIATSGVADDLAARETKVDAAASGVAEDLAAAHRRADEAGDVPGSAADAASQTPSSPTE